MFDNGPAPPPPPYTPPPPGRSRSNRTHSPPDVRPPSSPDGQSSDSDDENNGLAIGPIIGIVLGSLLVLLALIALVYCVRKAKRKETGARPSVESVPIGTEKGRYSLFFPLFLMLWMFSFCLPFYLLISGIIPGIYMVNMDFSYYCDSMGRNWLKLWNENT